jgi:hypothetical protein
MDVGTPVRVDPLMSVHVEGAVHEPDPLLRKTACAESECAQDIMAPATHRTLTNEK